MSSDTAKFHDHKKSAAVLKHEIIGSYVVPFAQKTGLNSPGNRVAFIDGYAGPGRYKNGDEGSGAMLLRQARGRAPGRAVECHFVESHPETLASLRSVAAAEAGGVTYSITDGDIRSHLPAMLAQLTGVPLFVYLDPCGLPIPMDDVVSVFKRPGVRAPTEVLINLTAGLRRIAGLLHSDNAKEAALVRMDETCGGDWWRDVWLNLSPAKDSPNEAKMAAELAVVEGYAARLRERAGGAGTWIIDVKPRSDLKPLYYLVFATKSPEGMVTFGECASTGLEKWRKYLAKEAADGTLFGESDVWEESWKASEKELADAWVAILTERLTTELAKGTPFTVMERAAEILGDDLVGQVRQKHIRAALKRAQGNGALATDPKGDVYRLRLVPVTTS